MIVFVCLIWWIKVGDIFELIVVGFLFEYLFIFDMLNK